VPRRLALARQAGGFDSLGWILLGFLLGASLAVFALLHADISAITRPLAGAPAQPPSVPVIRYAPPAAPASPPLAGPSQRSAGDVASTQVQAALPIASPASGVSALASAGAASAHSATSGATPAAPKAAGPRSAAPGAPATDAPDADAQVADDAAASGMTSRAGAAPRQGQELY